MKKEIDNIDLSKFKHNFTGKVRFSDVDSFGVVHNVKYFYWLENARTEYFEDAGFELNPETFSKTMPMMVVHAEADYLGSCTLGDKYRIMTRISKIKKSSLNFENIVICEDKPVLLARAVLVHLNPLTHRPEKIPDWIRSKIADFEGENIEFVEEKKQGNN